MNQFGLLVADTALQANKELDKAFAHVHKLLNDGTCSTPALLRMIHLNIQIGKLKEAAQDLAVLQPREDWSDFSNEYLLQLRAELSIKEGKLFDAEVRLQEAIDVYNGSNSHLMLGQVFWLLGSSKHEYYKLAYKEFLMAAQLDTFNSMAFLNLGHCQRLYLSNLSKAVQCYEKAFYLNKRNKDIGIALGDAYTALGRHEDAAALYASITGESTDRESSWAWARLGLILVKSGHADKAVTSFQHVLREDPSNSHYWECLAEAYHARGSYLSALKCFEKSKAFSGAESIYCEYMICSIKQKLGMHSEAVEGYEQLLVAHPSYLPALCGLAQTYLSKAEKSLQNVFDEQAVSSIQMVIEYASRGLKISASTCFLWKTIADACSLVHLLDPSLCRVQIPEILRSLVLTDNVILNKAGILDLATRSYFVITKLNSKCPDAWHDLGLSLYRQCLLDTSEGGRATLVIAVKAVQKSLNLDPISPASAVYWNSLGVMTGLSHFSVKCCDYSVEELADPNYSQHVFVRALRCRPEDALIWCNLGVLYLKHGKIKEAHVCYKKSLSVDPGYAPAWIGQASIAEMMGDEDAMDLYRHSTELQFHTEGARGYAFWMCSSFVLTNSFSIKRSTRPKEDISHLPKDCRGVLLNCSAVLQKAATRKPKDAQLLNMLGLLLEHQCLFGSAEQALNRAAQSLSGTDQKSSADAKCVNILMLNQARVLRATGKTKAAIEKYDLVNECGFEDFCNRGLCYFEDLDYSNALKAYSDALAVAENPDDKANAGVAKAMVAYAMKDFEASKSFLFQSLGLNDRNVYCLMALGSQAILHGDSKLAIASLSEILKCLQLPGMPEDLLIKAAFLMSSFYQIQGDLIRAKRILSKALLRFPWNNDVWRMMSNLLMTRSSWSMRSLSAVLQRISSSHSDEGAMRTRALASLLGDSRLRSSLRYFQCLVHAYPAASVSWLLLAAQLFSMRVSSGFFDSTYRTVSELFNFALRSLHAQARVGHGYISAACVQTTTMRQLLWALQLATMHEIYFGASTDVQSLFDRSLQLFSDWPNGHHEMVFFKHLAVLQEANVQGMAVDEHRLHMHSLVRHYSDTPDSSWKWKLLADSVLALGMPSFARICYRHQLQLAVISGVGTLPVLLSLICLLVQQFAVSGNILWLDYANLALLEAEKIDRSDDLVRFLRAFAPHGHT